MNDTERLTEAFREALSGASQEPTNDWVSVGRCFVAEAIDHMDWLERGLDEWRATALTNGRQAEAARATARIAINHLQSVLNKPRTHAEQQVADVAARDWLTSIGSDPN